MKFETPQMEIIRFAAEDVITTSGFDSTNAVTMNINGQTISVDRNKVSTIYGSCTFNGLVNGVDFICTKGYNA